MRPFFLLLAILLFVPSSDAQLRVNPYDTGGAKDWALLGIGIGLNISANVIGKQRPVFTASDIEELQTDRVWPIDRYSLRHFSNGAAKVSDKLLLTAAITPFFLFLDKPARNNAGDIGLILFEGALINAGLVRLTKVLAHRARPFNYNEAAPLDMKLTRNARHSFYSGHTATAAFFALSTAKIFSDLYPNSRARPYVWAGMSLIPIAVSYGRMRGGRHFFTDVLVGFVVGTGVALLVPNLHQN